MSMLPRIDAYLRASLPLMDVLGDPPRVWRQGEAPQKGDKPYVTWFVINALPDNQLSGTPTHDRIPVQFDVYHPTDAGVEELATLLRDALEGVAHMTAWRNHPKDPQARLYRMGLDFDFIQGRAANSFT